MHFLAGIVDRVVQDADLGVLEHLVRRFVPLLVGDDLDDGLGRLAKFPDEVRAVPLGFRTRRCFDVEAEQGVRNQRGLADGVKQADIGQGQERAARLPGAVERLGQQPLLLFRVDIVHGRIVLCDQVIDTGNQLRRQLCRDGLSGIGRIHGSHQWTPV